MQTSVVGMAMPTSASGALEWWQVISILLDATLHQPIVIGARQQAHALVWHLPVLAALPWHVMTRLPRFTMCPDGAGSSGKCHIKLLMHLANATLGALRACFEP